MLHVDTTARLRTRPCRSSWWKTDLCEWVSWTASVLVTKPKMPNVQKKKKKAEDSCITYKSPPPSHCLFCTHTESADAIRDSLGVCGKCVGVFCRSCYLSSLGLDWDFTQYQESRSGTARTLPHHQEKTSARTAEDLTPLLNPTAWSGLAEAHHNEDLAGSASNEHLPSSGCRLNTHTHFAYIFPSDRVVPTGNTAAPMASLTWHFVRRQHKRSSRWPSSLFCRLSGDAHKSACTAPTMRRPPRRHPQVPSRPCLFVPPRHWGPPHRKHWRSRPRRSQGTLPCPPPTLQHYFATLWRHKTPVFRCKETFF